MMIISIDVDGFPPDIGKIALLFLFILGAVLFLVITPSVFRAWWYRRVYKRLPFRITGLRNVLRVCSRDIENYVKCCITIFTRDIVVDEVGYIDQNNNVSRSVQAAILKLIALEGNRHLYQVLKDTGEWNEWAIDGLNHNSDHPATNSITGYVNYRLTARIVKLITNHVAGLQQQSGIIDEFSFTACK
jgi:hypothetical protein